MINYCQCGCGEAIENFSKHRKNIQKRFKHGHNTTWLPPALSGEDNKNWRGGRHVSRYGYIYIRKPDHPRATMGGYVAEHILVMESAIGRYVTKTEQVHHINNKRHDNRLENLKLCKNDADHKAQHALQRRKEISKRVCNVCHSSETKFIQNYHRWYKDKLRDGWVCATCARNQYRKLYNR